MILYMKQKVFSWADKFTIKDTMENDRYSVKGELFSWGHKLHVYNMQEQEVAFVKQKIFTILPRFEVYIDGRLVVEVKKEFTFFKPKYTLQGTDWTVDGNLSAHHYEIKSPAGTIATIARALISWGDSYQMDISSRADEILVIATILAIDCVLAARSNRGLIRAII